MVLPWVELIILRLSYYNRSARPGGIVFHEQRAWSVCRCGHTLLYYACSKQLLPLPCATTNVVAVSGWPPLSLQIVWGVPHTPALQPFGCTQVYKKNQ